MRITTVIGTTVTAAALALMFGQPALAGTHTVTAKPSARHLCGQASNGLGVLAITRKSKAKVCPTARRVGNLYLKKSSDEKRFTIVRVNKVNWKCGTVETEPPYIQCVNQKNKAEKVRLFS